MIPAAEMAAMVAEAERSLDTTANVQRATKTNDGLGHQTEVWNTVSGLGAMPCRIVTPNSPQYVAIAAKIGVEVVWLVRYSGTADVRGGDRLVIGANTLFVHVIGSPESYSVLNSAICAEVR